MPMDVERVLRRHPRLDFVKRILYPEDYPFLDLEDEKNYWGNPEKHGTVATHQMSHAPVDPQNPGGKWMAYPNIIYDPKKRVLHHLDPEEAKRRARSSKERIVFDSEAEAAEFATSYKKAFGAGKLPPVEGPFSRALVGGLKSLAHMGVVAATTKVSGPRPTRLRGLRTMLRSPRAGRKNPRVPEER